MKRSLAGLALILTIACPLAAAQALSKSETVVCITNPDAPKDMRAQKLMLIGPGDQKTLKRKIKESGAFTIPGPESAGDQSQIKLVISRRVVDGVAFTDRNLAMRKSGVLPDGHPAFLIGDMVNSKTMKFVLGGVRANHVDKNGYPFFDAAKSFLMNCKSLDRSDGNR